jgi:hypothetical protein
MLQLPLNLEPTTANPEPRTTNVEPRTLNPEPGTLNLPSPVLGTLVFVRHPRARRYLIRVTDDGTVRVTIPRRGSQREEAAFAARERAWIDKQCALDERRSRGSIRTTNDRRSIGT